MADYVRKRTIKGRYTYWYADFVFPKDPVTGKRPIPRPFTGKTKAEAIAKRDAFAEHYKKNPKADDKGTFGAYLEREFLPAELERVSLPPTSKHHLSWQRYSDRKSRLKAVLQSQEARELMSTRIADLEPKMFKTYLQKREANLSTYRYNKLRQDLLLAIQGLFGKTRTPISEFVFYFRKFIAPAEEIPAPKKLYKPNDILAKLTNQKYPIEYRALVGFEFIVNCRPQDIMPFEWDDIDWSNKTFKLDKRLCVVRGADGKTASEVRPNIAKSGKGALRERLPLCKSDGSLNLLGSLLDELRRYRMKQGPASRFVFCHHDGTMLSKMRLRRLWVKIREEMELPEGKFYHLKHTGNSYAQANGISAKVQATKMGHGDERMASTVYREVLDPEMIAAFEVFDRQTAG